MARFEDLSGEILMAIFEYMHVQDVWTIFFNMNHRLSSLVFDSRLRLTADVSNIEKNDFNQFCSSLINTNFSNIYTLVLSNNFNRYPQIKNFLSQTTLQNFQSLHALTVIDINYMELVEISSQIKNMPSLNYLHVNTHEIFRQNELSQVCPMLLDKSNIRVLNISLHEKIQWPNGKPIDCCDAQVLSLDYISADRLELLLHRCPNVRALTATVDSRSVADEKSTGVIESQAIVIKPSFAQILYFRLSFRPFNASVLEKLLEMLPSVRHFSLKTLITSSEYLRSPFWSMLFQKTLPNLERIQMTIIAWINTKSQTNTYEDAFDRTNFLDGYRCDRYWLDRTQKRSFRCITHSDTNVVLEIR